MTKYKHPEILSTSVVAQSRLFAIESLELRFPMAKSVPMSG